MVVIDACVDHNHDHLVGAGVHLPRVEYGDIGPRHTAGLACVVQIPQLVEVRIVGKVLRDLQDVIRLCIDHPRVTLQGIDQRLVHVDRDKRQLEGLRLFHGRRIEIVHLGQPVFLVKRLNLLRCRARLKTHDQLAGHKGWHNRLVENLLSEATLPSWQDYCRQDYRHQGQDHHKREMERRPSHRILLSRRYAVVRPRNLLHQQVKLDYGKTMQKTWKTRRIARYCNRW